MRTISGVLLSLFTLACDSPGQRVFAGPVDVGESASGFEGNATGKIVYDDVPKTHILLKAHDGRADDAHYLLLDLDSARSPELPGELVSLAPMGVSRRDAMYEPTFYRSVSAHDGRGSWAVVEGEFDQYELLIRGPRAQQRRLGRIRPAAMSFVGEYLYVGYDKGIVAYDLRTKGMPKQIVRHYMLRGKAFDIFAREGELMIAVDDIRLPMYAATIWLSDDGSGTGSHLWRLPSQGGGSYRGAILRRNDAMLRDVLLLHSSHGHSYRYGQEIAWLQLESGKSIHGDPGDRRGDRTLKPANHEEFVRNGYSSPTSPLLSGSFYTRWLGIALARDLLWIAAGDRGLIYGPAAYKPDAKYKRVNIDGPCLDVANVNGEVWALIGGDEAALVRLGGEDRLGELAEWTALPFEFTSIVQ